MVTRELELPEREVHILAEEPPWAPTSVFGTTLTARHEMEAIETVRRWRRWQEWSKPQSTERLNRVIDRDERLVRAARRWSGDPLSPPAAGKFVPGDVAAMRFAVARDELRRRFQRRLERIDAGDDLGQSEKHAVALDVAAGHWLYEATPYFVSLSNLIGLVDCEIPDAADLADLQLPAEHIAVFFGGDITVPMDLVEADHSASELATRYEGSTRAHPEWGSADDLPASLISNPTVAIRRRQPVQLCGVVLHADTDGQLDDLVMWLTTVPDHTTAPRSLIYGWLSRSMLRHVGVNLAAAVAWGQWTAPTLGGGLDADPTLPRDVIRSKAFRRREPDGGAVGVRVLDARRTVQRASDDRGGTHASPITHRRRGHWRRQRVGPRDDWAYERRLIAPTIVNPGAEDGRLTVYRLPLPPSTSL